MTIMALTLLFLAAMMGGLAIDVMRFEARRMAMQNTLDVCVLNAASLRQTLDQKVIFDDCVAKNGLSSGVTNVAVTTGTAQKMVTASSAQDLPTSFMHWIGINNLTVKAQSAAVEGASNIEVSLVLDVSGSMAGTRLVAMKAAAKEFVNTLMRDDSKGRVSITLVPYNSQVNLGTDLIRKFNVSNIPTNAPLDRILQSQRLDQMRCIRLPDGVYGDSSAISRTTPYMAESFSDQLQSSRQISGFISWTDTAEAIPSSSFSNCQNQAANQVRLPGFSDTGTAPVGASAADRIAALFTRIDGLVAAGQTSIHMGMRWGLAFLDPTAQSIFAEYSAVGQMPPTYATKPAQFNDPDVMKVIVLMSDGQNTNQYLMNETFDSGLSPIWRGNDGNFSILHPSRPAASRYYVPHLNTFQATPWRNSTNSGADAVQITWPEVWQRWRVNYVAWQFYARALGTTSASRTAAFRAALDSFRTDYTAPTMDSQLQRVCNAARSRNVSVYTIAFEAPTNGQVQLQACATTPSRAYTASTTSISTVFSSIAGNITKLRLTQ